MKTLLKSLLFAVIAALGVPVFAAPENHEEFARQYMPESQAVFERFRKDCAETKKLREALAEDLHVMNRVPDEDAGYCALCKKITELENKETSWASLLKDAFFKYKAGTATSEKLAEADASLAKESLAWEKDVLKNLVKNSVANFCGLVTVKIPGKNYAFGKYEVTQSQYLSVMGKNPSRFEGGNLPVECVSWNDAVEFCEKLTARERTLGRISEAQKYRLPTENEWKHACRAGTYSSDLNLNRVGWLRYSETHPVGQKEPNAFGLYDMYGNVWEWTSTSFGGLPVYCGGSWGSYSTDRDYVPPSEHMSEHGFRVVLDLVSPDIECNASASLPEDVMQFVELVKEGISRENREEIFTIGAEFPFNGESIKITPEIRAELLKD